MSSTPETVCPKCGATEIKNYSWLRPLGVLLFVLNAITQLVLALVFFQGDQFWSRVGVVGTNIGWGVGFWFLTMRFQNWRCTKCKHFW